MTPEDLKSITFKITPKAHDRLIEMTNTLGISQFQVITVLLENIEADDPRLVSAAHQVKVDWSNMRAEARKARKALMSKVKKLSDDEIEALLKGLEGESEQGE